MYFLILQGNTWFIYLSLSFIYFFNAYKKYSVYLSICLSVCLSVFPPIHPSFHPPIYLPLRFMYFLILRGSIWFCFANINFRRITWCEMCCKICNFLFPPDLHHPASRWCVSHSVRSLRHILPIWHGPHSYAAPLRIKVCFDKILCRTGGLSAVHLRHTDGTNVRLSVVHLQIAAFPLLYVKLFRSCVYQRFR